MKLQGEVPTSFKLATTGGDGFQVSPTPAYFLQGLPTSPWRPASADITDVGFAGIRVVTAVDALSVRLAAGFVAATAFDQGDGIAYV